MLMLPLVSHDKYADGTQMDGQTDGRTPDRYITLSARRGQNKMRMLYIHRVMYANISTRSLLQKIIHRAGISLWAKN